MALGSIDSETVRAFLAVPLAPSFQNDVALLIEELRKVDPAVRWVRAVEIHLTLHFFGSIEKHVLPKISNEIKDVTRQTHPFEIFLKGTGAFPDGARPRVIWAGVEGDVKALSDLQSRLIKRIREAGFPTEEREFKPHLTLGRIKDFRKAHPIQLVDFPATAMKKISEIVLLQSHLSPDGAHYEAIEAYSLSAP